ncbi:hypothetical protein D920_02918 [Enterococcus faecalis 13-SD-W-01]|nr:hypothetical protein D920_02918 [Enterococcus faecalis 13-SD-W-01]
MNEKKIIQQIDKERLSCIENGQWAKSLYEAFAQQYHFKQNTVTVSNHAKFLSHLTPLFINLIDLNKDEFRNDAKNLKESLIRSNYAMEDPKLFHKYVSELVPNDPSSFIVTPLVYEERPDLHLVTATIQKKDGFYQVKIFDKAGIAPPERADPPLIPGNEQHKLRHINYIYEIKDTKNNFKNMIYALESGRCRFNIPLDRKTKKFTSTLFDYDFIPLRLLSKLAAKEYYGHEIRAIQVIGNCCVKSWTGCLKATLEQFLINKQKTNNESLNKLLTEIACHQLEKAGYGARTLQQFRTLNEHYSSNKTRRKNKQADFDRKINDSQSLNDYYINYSDSIQFNRINKPQLNVSLKKEKPSIVSGLKNVFRKKTELPSLYSLTDIEKQKIFKNTGIFISQFELKNVNKRILSAKIHVQSIQNNLQQYTGPTRHRMLR